MYRRQPSIVEASDCDSLRAESVRTFQMAQPESAKQGHHVNWTKVKLYITLVALVLVAAIAYVLYIDSRIQRLQQETTHKFQMMSTSTNVPLLKCTEICHSEFEGLEKRMDQLEAKLRKRKLKGNGVDVEERLGQFREEMLTGLQDEQRIRENLASEMNGLNQAKTAMQRQLTEVAGTVWEEQKEAENWDKRLYVVEKEVLLLTVGLGNLTESVSLQYDGRKKLEMSMKRRKEEYQGLRDILHELTAMEMRREGGGGNSSERAISPFPSVDTTKAPSNPRPANQDIIHSMINEACDQAVRNLMANSTSKDITFQVLDETDLDALTEKVTKLESDVDILLTTTKMFSDVPTTCHGHAQAGQVHSGEYEVDPDGQGMGEQPIKVSCRFDSGKAETIVSHDTELPVEIESCRGDGCHFRLVSYDGSIEQIKALVDLSLSCHQEIKFSCLQAPLTGYGHWLDASGDAQTYFDGANFGRWECACAANNTCQQTPRDDKCNCDAVLATDDWMSDQGTITNKTALPITGFSYGYLRPDSKAKISFGKLVCEGAREMPDVGSSCASIKRRNSRAMSGYYVLRKGEDVNEGIVVSYCHMNKDIFDPAMETTLGKMSVVYEACPESHKWAFDGGSKCCKSPIRHGGSNSCPNAEDPLLRFSDPTACCRGSDFVNCPTTVGSCNSESERVSCPKSHPFPFWHGAKCCSSSEGLQTPECGTNGTLALEDSISCCLESDTVDCMIGHLCKPFEKLCFHKAASKMTHREAMDYCNSNPKYVPLLLKTKTELLEMANAVRETDDIWIPLSPIPGLATNCEDSACSGRFAWGDGSEYDSSEDDAISFVQNENLPCFRLLPQSKQINDHACSNDYAAVCAYHC